MNYRQYLPRITLTKILKPTHKQSARTQHDNHFKEQILRIWQESGCRYGHRKIWHVLKQEGYLMVHCRIERLIGIKRGKPKKTTNSKPK